MSDLINNAFRAPRKRGAFSVISETGYGVHSRLFKLLTALSYYARKTIIKFQYPGE